MTDTMAPPTSPSRFTKLTAKWAVINAKLDTPVKRTAAISLGAFMIVSLARVIAGADNMTTGFTFGSGLAAATPIMLAGLAGLVSERSGTVNIGLEGMLTLGTWTAGFAGWHWGIWWAIPAGVIGGALGGLLHALATVNFGVNHVVSGIAINLIAPGVTRFLAGQYFAGHGDGSITTSPTMKGSMGNFTLPFLSGGKLFGWKSTDPLGWLDRQRWFLVSDLAGLLKGITTRLDWTTMIALITLAFISYLLWRTPLGLRLRSVGEKPTAADSLGVPVYRMRYLGCVISGGLAGLGGAWLAINVRTYQEGQAGGRGFLGLAALVFGNWLPAGLAAGAGLFGYVQALSSLANTEPVRALILLGAAGVAGFSVVQWVRRRVLNGTLLGITAVLLLLFFIMTDRVNDKLVYVMPYLVTLVVITAASQNLRPPAAEGIPWHKGTTE